MSSAEQTASSVDNLWDFLRGLLKTPDEQRSGHEQREVGVRREREREPWIGRLVKARISIGAEGHYLVLGWLRSVTDEGIELSPRLHPDPWEDLAFKRPKFYLWACVSADRAKKYPAYVWSQSGRKDRPG